MKQEGLQYFTDTYLTSVGLMVFFLFFVVMFFWIMSRKRNAYVAHMENLPLENHEVQNGTR